MKKVFGFLLITVFLWSCGSHFSKSRYDGYMWNRSSGKTVGDANVTDEVKSNLSLTRDEVSKMEIKLDKLENSDASLIAKRNENTYDFHVMEDNRSKSEFQSELNNYQSVTELPKDEQNNPIKAFKKSGFKKMASNGNSDLGNILMIILLVILIILAFSLLNTLLGGTLSTILGIVLLVILLYFIFKVLGLI
jgi:ABC-type bacteriocin/lantibiotic exporter with double-glycine peptidase domain